MLDTCAYAFYGLFQLRSASPGQAPWMREGAPPPPPPPPLLVRALFRVPPGGATKTRTLSDDEPASFLLKLFNCVMRPNSMTRGRMQVECHCFLVNRSQTLECTRWEAIHSQASSWNLRRAASFASLSLLDSSADTVALASGKQDSATTPWCRAHVMLGDLQRTSSW